MGRVEDIRNIEIVHMVPMGEALYCHPQYASSFRHVALFSGAPTREAIWENRADYIPYFFSEIPSLFEKYCP